MKIFIDTANVDEIREAASWGVLSGVTTNPSLIAKEGRDFKTVVKEITEISEQSSSNIVSVSAEVLSDDAEGMIAEAHELVKIHDVITIKIPMTEEGLKAVSVLSKEGIKTNVTLIFSANQALLAARAGASYVSPFVGRLNDISSRGNELVETIHNMFEKHGITTEIIAASIRNPIHAVEAARRGADIATIPYKVLMQMIHHPLTDAGIERFLKDWDNAFHA